MKVQTKRAMCICAASLLLTAAFAIAGCAQQGSPEQGSDLTEFDAAEAPEPSLGQKIDAAADRLCAAMSLEEKAAQLFVVSPESLTGVGQVVAAGDMTRACLADMPVGGLVYFQANLQDESQTADMLSATQAMTQELGIAPLFLCVDEEGGAVSRIGGNPGFSTDNVGEMSTVGATGDVAYAQSVAAQIGSYLKPLGFNTDFAPVADIADIEGSMMVARSFGADAALVSEMVAAQVKGFEEAGIVCCAKHFPGIGSSVADSHTDGIVSYRTLEEIGSFELAPFQAAIDAGVPFIMVGHLSLPEVTGNDTPASLSAAIVQDILREKMSFDGVVVTDSLAMGAVTNYYGASESAVAALRAGCDIALMPNDLNAAYVGVLDAINDGTLSEERVDASVKRILKAKLTYFPQLFSQEIQQMLA